MLKQSLSQKMLQKLSPQQIQLMKLLQVPTAMLEQRIKEELEANPALEEGQGDNPDFEKEGPDQDLEIDDFGDEPAREEEYELDDYLNDYMEDDPSMYRQGAEGRFAEEEDKDVPIAVQDTFHEFLEQQAGLLEYESPEEELVALQIIGSIDEDGYLRREPENIIDDLMFGQGLKVSKDLVDRMLEKIQTFDPPGTGARDLQECLSIQLGLKMKNEDLRLAELATVHLAKQIIDEYFDIFSKKHFDKLIRQLDIAEEDLRDAIQVITKLNPKPSSGYTTDRSRAVQYVVPDFIINNREGELELSLNTRNAPELHVNEQYQDMLRSYKSNRNKRSKSDKEAVVFIKQKIDSAKWFIDAIRQRQQTMYKSMYAILQYQYDYFLTGDQKKLRPMILKDIADITGLDISTISRVANSKFVQTEFGTKRLKDFFSESLQTQDGEEVSTREVKKILSEMIEAENKRKPLSDEKLKNILQEKGYNIARRTVAKYREQLNIPVARLRKEL